MNLDYVYRVKLIQSNRSFPVEITSVIHLQVVAQTMTEAIQKALSFFGSIKVRVINVEELGLLTEDEENRMKEVARKFDLVVDCDF